MMQPEPQAPALKEELAAKFATEATLKKLHEELENGMNRADAEAHLAVALALVDKKKPITTTLTFQKTLGQLFRKAGQFQRAIEVYTLVAKQDSNEGNLRLGGIYYFQCQDSTTAIQFLEMSQDPNAQLLLAQIYLGVDWKSAKTTINYAKAHQILSKCLAETNDRRGDASLLLGFMYEYGLGVASNLEKARDHYAAAAKYGVVGNFAQAYLSDLYFKHQWTRPNDFNAGNTPLGYYVAAKTWLRIRNHSSQSFTDCTEKAVKLLRTFHDYLFSNALLAKLIQTGQTSGTMIEAATLFRAAILALRKFRGRNLVAGSGELLKLLVPGEYDKRLNDYMSQLRTIAKTTPEAAYYELTAGESFSMPKFLQLCRSDFKFFQMFIDDVTNTKDLNFLLQCPLLPAWYRMLKQQPILMRWLMNPSDATFADKISLEDKFCTVLCMLMYSCKHGTLTAALPTMNTFIGLFSSAESKRTAEALTKKAELLHVMCEQLSAQDVFIQSMQPVATPMNAQEQLARQACLVEKAELICAHFKELQPLVTKAPLSEENKQFFQTYIDLMLKTFDAYNKDLQNKIEIEKKHGSQQVEALEENGEAYGL